MPMIKNYFNKLPVERFFLFTALIFGLIYVFILPPFQSVDEANHFYRSYEIASGEYVSKNQHGEVGNYLPSSINTFANSYEYLIKNIDAKVNLKYILDSGKRKLNPDNQHFINFQNTALYSPICYLSQAPTIFVAKTLKLNPLVIFYLTRISSLLMFVFIVYWAIKIIPSYKLTLSLLALMPMTLSLASSITSDVAVIGFNFLWIALLYKLMTQETKISNLQIFSLILLSILLTLSKHYFMLIPLIFLLPKSKFQTYKYFFCTTGVIIFTVIGLYSWQHIINNFGYAMSANADVKGQLDFILHNPISYLIVLLKTFIIKLPRIVITMIGVLGWQDTRLDFLTYIMYPILIFISFFSERNKAVKLVKWQINLILLDVIISTVIIFTNMYIMWSKVASNIIYGLNGKYFIPMVLPFLMLFQGSDKKTVLDNIKLPIYVAIILILISSDLSLIHRFYTLTPDLYYKI